MRLGLDQPPHADLSRRLVWLSTFRVVAVTVLVALGSVVSFREGDVEGMKAVGALSSLAVAVNLLQIGTAILLRMRRSLWSLAAAQLVGDLVFAFFLVLFTGAEDSLFSFAFPLAVVSGGILLGSTGAWAAASVTLLLYAGMLLLRREGWAGPLELLPPPSLDGVGMAKALFANGSAAFLSAALVGYVTRQAERARKRADAAESTLVELNLLHDAIVRSLASGIATTDRNGRVTLLNPAAEEILGARKDELVGKPLETIFPPLRGRVEGEASRLECVWETPTGQRRILGFTLTPLESPSGGSLGTAVVFQNLTQVRELEERAALSERLAAVGEVAAGLAHELRNPLGAISGSIEMIADARDPAERRLLAIAMREVDRLDGLITQFLDFAHPALPNFGPVELASMVEETCALLANDPKLGRSDWELDLLPAQAWADGGQVKQVLWNLMRNAAEAAGPSRGLRIACGTEAVDRQVFLCVEDEGPGMPPEVLDRIFDPFFTTKQGGTGLGLATVHRIVDGLGGRIELKSAPGAGTRVKLVLPAMEGRD